MPGEPTTSEEPRPTGQRISLLLVDDDEPVRRSFRRTFGRSWDITAVDSGAAALEALRSTRFDVALLDYAMPGMNGIELVHRMEAEHPAVPRIMLTAYADLPEILSLRELDLVVAAVMKPWERGDVEDAVARALRVAAMRRAVDEMATAVGRLPAGAAGH